MKFGHNLPRNQVPEWAASYINYKGLKKLIKNAAEASKDGSAPDLAGMFTVFLVKLHIKHPHGSAAFAKLFDI
jgi:hypothetical protein